jgi:hypothetical protein
VVGAGDGGGGGGRAAPLLDQRAAAVGHLHRECWRSSRSIHYLQGTTGGRYDGFGQPPWQAYMYLQPA